MTILIVNNDPFFLNSLQHAFEIHGNNVISSRISTTVQNLFIHHQPHAVVLDVFMEDKDGFEVLKELRSVCKKTLVIAVSKDDRYLLAIQKMGANLALLKSTDTSCIVNAVSKKLTVTPAPLLTAPRHSTSCTQALSHPLKITV